MNAQCDADIARIIKPPGVSGARMGSRRVFNRQHVRCPHKAVGTRRLNNHTGFEAHMGGITWIEGAVCRRHLNMERRPDYWEIWQR